MSLSAISARPWPMKQLLTTVDDYTGLGDEATHSKACVERGLVQS